MEKKRVAKLGEKSLTYSTRIVLALTDDPEVFVTLEKDSVAYAGPWARCDRSLQSAATGAAGTAAGTAAGLQSNAKQINGTLTPTLERMATNPSGYSPTDVNNMTVAGEQAAGGANSSLVGRAANAAARTHNVGATSAVEDAAGRAKMATNSNVALGVQNQDAQLKQQQQQSALKQLTGLYGVNVGGGNAAAGQVAGDVNAGVNAGNSGWLQNTMGVLGGMSKMASQGAGIAGGYAG